jgi:hypothetical protein
MMNDTDEQRLSAAARRVLDEAAAHLDDVTLERLRAARERAVAAAQAGPRPARTRRPGLWWPLGVAVSASMVAAVGAWLWFAQPADIGRSLVTSVDDLELLAQQETPDFYADLEFYRWLAAQRPAG